MTQVLIPESLNATAFAPFGDVLDNTGDPDIMINQGMCGRFHDRASLDFTDGRAGISIFQAQPRALPYTVDMVERHPLGSQAFIPISQKPFLVIVAEDLDGTPHRLRAFETSPGQAINLHKGVWHGVLTPLYWPATFAVVDRMGDGDNLQEHWFEHPWVVQSEP